MYFSDHLCHTLNGKPVSLDCLLMWHTSTVLREQSFFFFFTVGEQQISVWFLNVCGEP